MRVMLLTDPIILHEPLSAYGKVGYYIYRMLRDKHRFAHTPIGRTNNFGRFEIDDLVVYPSGEHPFSEDIVLSNYCDFESDACLVLKDPFAFSRIHRMPMEIIWYLALDHENPHEKIVDMMKLVFSVVTPTEFGKRELERKRVKVDAVIPHGVDPEVYRPVYDEEREECKRFFNLNPYSFVIGFIGRNQPRKMPTRIIQIFRRLIEIEPEADISLLMWTHPTFETNILHPIIEMDLKDRVYWPSIETYQHGIPESDMWRLYNAVDLVIGVGAEGFWLPAVEAMACGIPSAHVDYAGASEVAQFTFRASDWTYNNAVGVKQPVADIDDAVRVILDVYNSDWDRLRRKQLKRAEKYCWDRIKPMWVRLFEKYEEILSPKIRGEKK